MTTTEQTMRVLQRALRKARPKRPRISLAAAVIVGGVSVVAYSAYRDHSEPITGQQLFILNGMVAHASETAEQPAGKVWQRLYDRFQIETPLQLRQREFAKAVEFLASMTDDDA